MARPNAKVAAVAVIVLLIGIGAAVTLSGSGGDEESSGEVFLEPASAVGESPFTPNMDTSSAEEVAPRPRRASAATPAGPEGSTAVTAVGGTSPGLYGGVRDEAACDVDGIIAALARDPGSSAGFASGAGITTTELGDHLANLTPVVLRVDTRVTDHLLDGGTAMPMQAILEAGTSVLIDATGVPRVRCATGSPLLPPLPARSTPRYTGQRWDRFDPARVVVVTRAPVRVEQIVIVDLVVPGYFVRPTSPATEPGPPADGDVSIDTTCDLYPEACGASVGDPALGSAEEGVDFVLRWHSTADLDLAVTDPSGNTVSFEQPSAGGGELSADINGACRAPTSAPVETIRWPASAVPGDYEVTVTYYGTCPGAEGPQPYELSAVIGGDEVGAAGAVVGLPTRPGGVAHDVVRLTVPSAAIANSNVPLKSGSLANVGDTETASLSVPAATSLRPPPPVFAFSATGLAGGGVLLQWVPGTPGIDDGLETAYVITVSPGGAVIRVPANQIDIELPGFEPGVEYTFTMTTENADGQSSPTSQTAVVPIDEEPPDTGPTTTVQPEPTLEDYCNEQYGPPPDPGQEATNPMWTLCMHDPTA